MSANAGTCYRAPMRFPLPDGKYAAGHVLCYNEPAVSIGIEWSVYDGAAKFLDTRGRVVHIRRGYIRKPMSAAASWPLS